MSHKSLRVPPVVLMSQHYEPIAHLLPGLSSMQCMTLPKGKLRSGMALPTLIGADDPERTVAPAFRPSGAMM